MSPQEKIKSTDAPVSEKKLRRKGILYRTAFLSWIVVIFTVAIFVFSIIPYQRAQLLQEMITRAKVTFTSIAQVTVTSILLEDYSTIVDHCMTVLGENPSILYAVITRHDGFSMVHTKGKWTQEQLSGFWTPKQGKFLKNGQFKKGTIVDREVFHRTFPFSYSGINWGWIHIGLSPDKFYSDLKSLYLRTFLIALLSISVGLAASYFFAKRISKPILILDQFTRRVGTGDLSARLEISTGDELESLANSFNQMTVALLKSNKELDKTHKKLLETARNVGMAEVATGILHNVGNVLNSVGVTSTSIKNRLTNSKVDHIAKIAKQLEENADDIASFMTTDDRGKKLPLFLTSLSDHLTDEQDKLIKDMEILTGHVQHITEIVNLQQSYSKTVGLSELVSITELVDDAIRINDDALVRHQIKVKPEYQSIPPFMLDRHKVLQILLNLIGNAKQALSQNDNTDKHIIIRITFASNTYVQIEVTDNGIGISEENLTKIFNYGFTTKEKGHGFGLHSGALSAKEMGGSLSVCSDGLGKGSTFILELPYTPGESPHGYGK